MKITEKIKFEFETLCKYGAINIVIFGDSVSHGAFGKDQLDYEEVYWRKLQKKIYAVRDYTPVNMINSAIGGDTATHALPRLQRDVISHHPDLCIVCFGLNDVNCPIEDYESSLKTIFTECNNNGIEVIFMTPNMLNTYSADDTEQKYKEYSVITAEWQNNGKMDSYMETARKVAEECGVTVCDCYAEWKKMEAEGKDITMLLDNRINHPTREMHNLFADKLFDIIFCEDYNLKTTDESTMYRG